MMGMYCTKVAVLYSLGSPAASNTLPIMSHSSKLPRVMGSPEDSIWG
jgi:hypothetical protein